MRPAAALLPAALAAALLVGCAGQTTTKNAKDYDGDQKAVAQVIDDLSAAGSDGDAKEICSAVFAPEVADALKQGAEDCTSVVEDQLTDANVFDLDVTSIAVDGDSATAVVESEFDGTDEPRTLTFAKVGNGWRLAGIAGS